MKSEVPVEHGTFITLAVPTVGGGTPTAYGAPFVGGSGSLPQADAAFMGIQWGAPVLPEFIYVGYGANYGATGASPGQFRLTSLRHRGGFLPERDVSVFERLRLVDVGDITATGTMEDLLESVSTRVAAMRRDRCVAITYGGNAGPSSYAVLRGIARECDGPVAIVNFDAHGDNWAGNWRHDAPEQSRWASTWVHQMLELPEVDPGCYRHVGLRGPVNDPEIFTRFNDQGVKREHIVSYQELKAARRRGFDDWLDEWTAAAVHGAGAVWVAIDIDVLDMGSNPDYADEPFGPSADEMIDMVAAIARVAGRDRFAGLSFMAVPPQAARLHVIASYTILHALASVAGDTGTPDRVPTDGG
jgi:arginase family enzyme